MKSQRKIKKSFELKDNKNMTSKLWDAAKTMNRVQFIALNACARKEKKSII